MGQQQEQQHKKLHNHPLNVVCDDDGYDGCNESFCLVTDAAAVAVAVAYGDGY